MKCRRNCQVVEVGVIVGDDVTDVIVGVEVEVKVKAGVDVIVGDNVTDVIVGVEVEVKAGVDVIVGDVTDAISVLVLMVQLHEEVSNKIQGAPPLVAPQKTFRLLDVLRETQVSGHTGDQSNQ